MFVDIREVFWSRMMMMFDDTFICCVCVDNTGVFTTAEHLC